MQSFTFVAPYVSNIPIRDKKVQTDIFVHKLQSSIEYVHITTKWHVNKH